MLHLALMLGMSLTTYAYDNNPYSDFIPTANDDAAALTSKQVTFNDEPWHIIEYNPAIATAGTVTLLAADAHFEKSIFNSGANVYKESKVKRYLDEKTRNGPNGTYAGVADAIVNKTDNGDDIGKLYLLSTDEANNIPPNVLVMEFDGSPDNSDRFKWWLRTPGTYETDYSKQAAYVDYNIVQADGMRVIQEYGVRPALQLDLSKVTFSSDTKTFTVNPTISTDPTASAIIYGQTLAGSTLTGGEAKCGDYTVDGTFTWKDSTTKPAVSDSQTKEYEVVFTPKEPTVYSTAACKVKLTVNKADQTITAENVTAAYGDKNKSVNATSSGDGKISFAVKDGSGDYIDVNASTGALTIKKIGEATVVITAAGNENYTQAIKEVTVTINKADSIPATVKANSRAYDRTEQPLVTVTGKASGGTMHYALGTAAEATEPYITSIPAKTDAGTYYVWYKVVGDDNHNDTEPNYVEVTISLNPEPHKDDGITFFRLDDGYILPKTGFSAGSLLPEKPMDLNYKPIQQTLEIPSVSVSSEIVSVPFVDGEYPMTWLGADAGLLEGSAIPGKGQSVLTGHNHLNTMEAGPFAYLISIETGDRIFVRDENGDLRIFVVYANEKVAENDISGVNRIIASDPQSLTLITCEDERPEGGYANRRVVAAKPL